MHELGITKYLFQQVMEEAEKVKAKEVIRVHLLLGELSGYVSDSIQLYWDNFAKESIAQNAQITYTYQKVNWYCNDCHHIFEYPTKDTQCPQCTSDRIRINSGSECTIKRIEFA